jgi:hypothetical protein
MRFRELSACAVALAGCRFIIDTDQLQSGTPAGSDGGPMVADSGADSVKDSGGADVVEEKAPEAGPVAFCLSHTPNHFCADFDVPGQNYGREIGTDGTFTVDSMLALSPTSSSLLTTPPGPAEGYKQQRRFVALPTNAQKSVTLEFAFYTDAAAESGSSIELGAIEFGNAETPRSGAQFYLIPDGLQLAGFNRPDANPANAAYPGKTLAQPAKNTWHTVKLVLTAGNPANGGTGGTIAATFGGVTETLPLQTSANIGDGVRYGPGVYRGTEGPFGAMKVRYDNILVTVQQ